MIDLPQLKDLDVVGKRVIVRADLDLTDEVYRLEALFPTLKYLFERKCDITLIGHRGRPSFAEATEGDAQFSLKPVEEKLRRIAPGINFMMLENLRFDLGEMENSLEYAKKLIENQDVYVNESFAESHREVASIVGLPKLLPHAAGLRFIQEVENLSKVLENPKRPLVIIIGGVKEDKLSYIKPFEKFADKILVGGRLPEHLPTIRGVASQHLGGGRNGLLRGEQVIVADLLPDKEDLTIHSIEKFEEEIAKAGTIVVAGPIGRFEDKGHRQGTEKVFQAVVANTGAFKVAGGGDTQEAISLLSLADGFSWISVGGGAMLEFLTKGTLPGIEALLY